MISETARMILIKLCAYMQFKKIRLGLGSRSQKNVHSLSFDEKHPHAFLVGVAYVARTTGIVTLI